MTCACFQHTTAHTCVANVDSCPGAYLHSPCQWCCGGRCTTNGHRCEPLSWLTGQSDFLGVMRNATSDSCATPHMIRTANTIGHHARRSPAGLRSIAHEEMLRYRRTHKRASVVIKVGVLLREVRPANEFWIELDPTVDAFVAANHVILPVAAALETSTQATFHFRPTHPGCSSMLMASGAYDEERRYSYYDIARRLCASVVTTTRASDWYLWDKPTPSADRLQAGIHPCYRCQDATEPMQRRVVPSLRLADLVRSLVAPPRAFLDALEMDAQGQDVALLLDLGALVRHIGRVRLECQQPTYLECGPPDVADGAAGGQRSSCKNVQVHDFWLYNSSVQNDCSVAMSFLARHGFGETTARLQVNNCGCGEFNLHMENTGAHQAVLRREP